MTKQTKKQVGEAYAFFNCNASKVQIEAELPQIRTLTETPNELELSLTEGIDPQSYEHPQLRRIAQEAKDSGIKYAMNARYKDATNKETTDHLSGILNQAYQSPLYQEGEQFCGEIVFQNKGRYVFRD